MITSTESLTQVLEQSQARLQTAEKAVASTASVAERGVASAQVAQESLFAEALLGAMHARFAACKEATHG